jgi:hypothetical protein
MLIAHRAGRDAHRPVVEGADERILFDLEARGREFLRETPEFAPPAIGASSSRNMQCV